MPHAVLSNQCDKKHTAISNNELRLSHLDASNPMDLAFFFTGLFVIMVALFKRELLVEGRSFLTILAISIALSFIGIVLHFTDFGRHSASGALLGPLMTLGLYRLLRKAFLKFTHREPRDTFMDWTAGMAADRVFNILYFMSAAFLTIFGAIGMQELAKRGW